MHILGLYVSNLHRISILCVCLPKKVNYWQICCLISKYEYNRIGNIVWILHNLYSNDNVLWIKIWSFWAMHRVHVHTWSTTADRIIDDTSPISEFSSLQTPIVQTIFSYHSRSYDRYFVKRKQFVKYFVSSTLFCLRFVEYLSQIRLELAWVLRTVVWWNQRDVCFLGSSIILDVSFLFSIFVFVGR